MKSDRSEYKWKSKTTNKERRILKGKLKICIIMIIYNISFIDSPLGRGWPESMYISTDI